MKISDLKHLQVFYDVVDLKIKRYRYMCVHPRRGLYHILLDESDNPIRIYHGFLQTILNKNLFSYEDATKELLKSLEDRINFIKKVE